VHLSRGIQLRRPISIVYPSPRSPTTTAACARTKTQCKEDLKCLEHRNRHKFLSRAVCELLVRFSLFVCPSMTPCPMLESSQIAQYRPQSRCCRQLSATVTSAVTQHACATLKACHHLEDLSVFFFIVCLNHFLSNGPSTWRFHSVASEQISTPNASKCTF